MSDAITLEYVNVAGRQFFRVGNTMIPVDRIKSIDLDPPNGGCNNSVRIVTDDPEDDYIWAYENADVIRSFLGLKTKYDGLVWTLR